ncbi:MAG: protein kinase [Thermoanaerobaculia bacterium]
MQPGSRLGSYEIIAPLGAGGMGEVYRASDARLGREVAIKVLSEKTANDPASVARFTREARAVAALNHPHIVTIYSTEEEEGIRFITMELVEGRTLGELLPAGGLPMAQLFDIAIPLCDALSAAHQKLITHRDLKPANVMVSNDGRVKVLDFGLARSAEPERAPGSREDEQTELRLTRCGTIVGTIPYMSPEQIEGKPLDPRSDLFSLGIMLYEMVTGRRPFNGDSSPALMASIMREQPRPAVELRADVPVELSRLIDRCLGKQPHERIQTAGLLLETLRMQRRAWESAAGVYTPIGAAPPAPSIAVMPFADMSAARDQDWFCEGMAEEIMNSLASVRELRVSSRTSTFKVSRDGADLNAIASALSVSHVLEGSVRTAGSRVRVTARLTEVAGDAQLWSERYDREVADLFAVQDEIAASVVAAIKVQLTHDGRVVAPREQVRNIDAYRLHLRGRFLRHTKNDHAGALASFEEAVRLDPDYAPAWVGVAEVNVLAAHYGMIPARTACSRAREALATAARLQGDSPEALYVEGFAAFVERRWEPCEVAYRRALELRPAHVQALGSFGLILSARQRFDEARPFLERAREADPLAAFPLAITGAALVTEGRLLDALRFFDDAFAFESENSLALWGAGIAQVALGRYDEGIALLEKGVAVSRRAAFFVGLLGWGLASAGRADEARAILEELRSREGEESVCVSDAWLLAALGDRDAAFAALSLAEEAGRAFVTYPGLPGFDPLRDDPRFTALLGRLGLQP